MSKDGTKVLILKYSLDNNFQQFKDQLLQAILKEYGNIGRLVKTKDYYQPNPINETKYDMSMTGDPHGSNKALYL
jgi:hypothetical protein